MNTVTDHRADAIPPHLAGRVGHDAVGVVEPDAETAVGQDFVDFAFDGDERFFGQYGPFVEGGWIADGNGLPLGSAERARKGRIGPTIGPSNSVAGDFSHP